MHIHTYLKARNVLKSRRSSYAYVREEKKKTKEVEQKSELIYFVSPDKHPFPVAGSYAGFLLLKIIKHVNYL